MTDPDQFDLPRQSRAAAAMLLAMAALSFIEAAALQRSGVHNNDFKHLWAGARILLDGGNPYDPDLMLLAARQHGFASVNPFVYLPAAGLLMAPLALLPFGVAAFVWFWGNWAAAWACVAAGPRLLKLPNAGLAQAAGAAFLVGAQPFMRQMTAGQMNVVLLAAFLLALVFLARGRDLSAGAILGLAAAYKIAPLFMLFALAGMRRGRAAAAGAFVFILANAASAAFFGADILSASLPVIGGMGYGRSTWPEFGMDFYRDPYNHSVNSLMHRLFTENPHSAPWAALGPGAANALTWAFSLALLAFVAFALARYRRPPYFRAEWSGAEAGLFCICWMAMLLLPSIFWDHYAVQAIFVFMWFAGSAEWRRRPALAVPALVVFALLVYPVASSAPAMREGFGILASSVRLWAALGVLALAAGQWEEEMRRRLG